MNEYGVDNGKSGNGRFLPGNSGKPQGSPRNKLRDDIRKFLGENWSNFPTWFEQLKPKEKIDTILDLLPYAVGRLQCVSMTDQEGNDMENKNVPTIDWTKLSESALKEVLTLTTIQQHEEQK